MGFVGVREWADARGSRALPPDHLPQGRRPAATVANDFVDYTYFAGNPPANFYASAPLEAAHVEAIRGIHVPNVAGQFVKSLTVMTAAASATGTTNQNQRFVPVRLPALLPVHRHRCGRRATGHGPDRRAAALHGRARCPADGCRPVRRVDGRHLHRVPPTRTASAGAPAP